MNAENLARHIIYQLQSRDLMNPVGETLAQIDHSIRAGRELVQFMLENKGAAPIKEQV